MYQSDPENGEALLDARFARSVFAQFVVGKL